MPLDAIVVLGCRIGPLGRPSEAATRRAERAAAAWRAGLAPLIVVSGGRRWHGVAEAQALMTYLATQGGVAEKAMVGEWCSLSTDENAWYVARLLSCRGASRVGVVTCDWHMPRALAAFRAVGLLCEPLPARSPRGAFGQGSWRWLAEAVRRRCSRPPTLGFHAFESGPTSPPTWGRT